MATRSPHRLIDHLRRIAPVPQTPNRADGQLVEDYIARRDETAFATLVHRHGSMVWGVCLRLLRNEHDAEDAFQAVFLVLMRKANTIKPRNKVANWLYGVAYHTAQKAQALRAKRRAREQQVATLPQPEATMADFDHDLAPVLDQALLGLPENYRSAVLLCDLEGKSYKQAAELLACPPGTVASRLKRGRDLLAKRLARRGVTARGITLAAALAKHAAHASAPIGVVNTTIQAASLCAAGQTVAQVVSTDVAMLMQGVLKTMFVQNLIRRSVLACLAMLVLAAGVGIGVHAIAAQDGGMPPENPGAIGGAGENPADAAASKTVVTSWRVASVFHDNDALADEKYTNKVLRVRDRVNRVRRSPNVMKARSHYMLFLGQQMRPAMSHPVFEFNVSSRKELAKLKRNQEVIVSGKCFGRTKIGDQEVILFSDCRIVAVMPMNRGLPGAGNDAGVNPIFPGIPGQPPGGVNPQSEYNSGGLPGQPPGAGDAGGDPNSGIQPGDPASVNPDAGEDPLSKGGALPALGRPRVGGK